MINIIIDINLVSTINILNLNKLLYNVLYYIVVQCLIRLLSQCAISYKIQAIFSLNGVYLMYTVRCNNITAYFFHGWVLANTS